MLTFSGFWDAKILLSSPFLNSPPLSHLPKGMATHSSILAWSIPWTEESIRLQSMGSQRGRYDWSDLAHTSPSQTWKLFAYDLVLSLLWFLPRAFYLDCPFSCPDSSPCLILFFLSSRPNWKFDTNRCKLVYIRWINKVLLYGTKDCSQYPMINHNRKNMKKNIYNSTTLL